jgi:flagellin-like protein
MTRKGITPIIAIIVLLLITVALAGAAWSYLSGIMKIYTSTSVDVVRYFCLNDGTPVVIMTNLGTSPLDVEELIVIDMLNGDTVSGWEGATVTEEWTYIRNDTTLLTVDPGHQVMWKGNATSCGTSCTYQIIAGASKLPQIRIVC